MREGWEGLVVEWCVQAGSSEPKRVGRAAVSLRCTCIGQEGTKEHLLHMIGVRTKDQDEDTPLLCTRPLTLFSGVLEALKRVGSSRGSLAWQMALSLNMPPMRTPPLQVFWKRFKELNDWEKVIKNIERGEQKIQRQQDIMNAIAAKLERYKNPWQELKVGGWDAG